MKKTELLKELLQDAIFALSSVDTDYSGCGYTNQLPPWMDRLREFLDANPELKNELGPLVGSK
jgi:hypothetical protein